MTMQAALQALRGGPPCAMTTVSSRLAFDAMVDVYKTCGGTARADDLAMLLEQRRVGDFVSVARQIVSRDIFSFEWQNHIWVPMFQFNPVDMSVKQEVRRVAHELAAVLDNWTLSQWFIEPNAWLNGKRPVHLMDNQFSSVLGAARADRFVAEG